MKITVVCAAGRQGALLVKEAALRGHEVTAVARKGDRVPAEAKAVIEKDLFDLTWDDLKEAIPYFFDKKWHQGPVWRHPGPWCFQGRNAEEQRGLAFTIPPKT